jgi:hypothetical protein
MVFVDKVSTDGIKSTLQSGYDHSYAMAASNDVEGQKVEVQFKLDVEGLLSEAFASMDEASDDAERIAAFDADAWVTKQVEAILELKNDLGMTSGPSL